LNKNIKKHKNNFNNIKNKAKINLIIIKHKFKFVKKIKKDKRKKFNKLIKECNKCKIVIKLQLTLSKNNFKIIKVQNIAKD